MNQDKILEFIHTIEKVKSTLRHSWLVSGRQESNAEHMWRVALLLLIFNNEIQPKFDLLKTLKMILIHDIPELTFGDIPGFVKISDPKKHQQHKDREHQEAIRLFKKLPQDLAVEFVSLYEEYEAKITTESKIAQALEKIEAQIQHLEAGPKSWNTLEKGEHMLHYPDQVVVLLNSPFITIFWKKIQKQLAEIQTNNKIRV